MGDREAREGIVVPARSSANKRQSDNTRRPGHSRTAVLYSEQCIS